MVGVDASPPGMNWLAAVLVALVLAAFAVAVFSAVRAHMLAQNHQPYRDLGMKRWVMGTLVVKYMPADAVQYAKRYVMAFSVFILALGGLIIQSVVRSAPLP